MDEIKEMDLESKDIIKERIEQLKQLFPEIVTEPASERESKF